MFVPIPSLPCLKIPIVSQCIEDKVPNHSLLHLSPSLLLSISLWLQETNSLEGPTEDLRAPTETSF